MNINEAIMKLSGGNIADGINADGSQNVVQARPECYSSLATAVLYTAGTTTELPIWPTQNLTHKTLYLKIVAASGGSASTVSVYERGSVDGLGSVSYSNTSSGSEVAIWSEAVAAGATVYRKVDLSACHDPYTKVAIGVAGANATITAIGWGE